ncbi:uncharacterized protein [Dysidea avara]|uniref:uncharacterized protein n=1 Tax=Dysidea avara TaxID=196820 RepID=UPI00331BAA09
MSLDIESFVKEPSLTVLSKLKRAELTQLAGHYKLTVANGAKKGEIRQIIVKYLHEEELISDDEIEEPSAIAIRRLELEARAKEREAELKVKELQLREKELEVQLRLKELEVSKSAAVSPPTSSRETGSRDIFDVSRHMKFVPSFSETEVDKFFLHFEKVAQSLKWPKDSWTLLLQSGLVGKARAVYSALSIEESSEYETVKTSILKAYELVPEAYRQRFRDSKKTDKQTYVEFGREKEMLFDRWCLSKNVDKNYVQLRQLVLVEEFKNCLPTELKTYIDEQKGENLHQAAVLADDYTLTHKPVFRHQSRDLPPHAGNRGYSSNPLSGGGGSQASGRASDPPVRRSQRFTTGPTCYYCKKKGHVMSECRALERKNHRVESDSLIIPKMVDVTDSVNETRNQGTSESVGGTADEVLLPFVSRGFVCLEGGTEKVPINVLRDTGATQSLLLDSVLPFSDQTSAGVSVLLQGVEMGVISVPLHVVSLQSDIVSGVVAVGLRPSLPVKGVSMILGNDLAGDKVTGEPRVSEVPCSITEAEQFSCFFPSCAVTRAMAKAAEKAADENNRPEEFSNGCREESVVINSGTPSSHGVPEMNSQPGCNHPLGLSPSRLVAEQERDFEIMNIKKGALSEREAEKVPVCYFLNSGNVVMRKWRPPNVPASNEWSVVYQVVVPPPYRKDILVLAHDTPLAGHLGIAKTYRKVLGHFYWPGLHGDVKKFCKTCHVCQLAGKPNQHPPVSPLIPIPTMEEPFSRIIVDCVGPLPKTRAGNQYLLTIMCASTRFPEAIPLRNIKADKIVKALIKFFTFVGLPKVVQSDQGSNFMSGLFQSVMVQLGIHQVKSTAYHPQSQGALERFHQTLKSMMRAYCMTQKHDWDEGIPLLLFAARESAQESLGFSPFELVFGHLPRGPLKLLKESWLNSDNDSSHSVITHITDVRERLKVANKLAQKNLRSSQSRMKQWYDKKARSRTFQPGDQVLVLLPIHGQPLQARYCGPYTVEQKVNDVDYLIQTPGRRKEKRLCHVNMLKPYHGREGNNDPVSVVSNCVSVGRKELNDRTLEDEEIGRSLRLKNSDVLLNLEQKLSHLPLQEKEVLTKLICEFTDLFPDVPGKTTVTVHDVDVGETSPIKQHPYRVNPVKLKLMRNEIEYMLRNGIIEPSQSQWSSPCVLVPKSDGTYRFCTDFRKLNGVSKTDSYPIPRVDDCIDRIGHAKYVSIFDLLKGYWQVPLTRRAQELSAFATPDGLFQYCVMPFGMKNAPATFQRMVNGVIRGLEGCDAYIDDLVIYSDSWEDHIQLLQKFFSRLRGAHLTVNLSKSEFCRARVKFLGHIVGQGEVAPVVSKVEAILKFPTPVDKREIMRFLGMAGYYRKFCYNFSTIAEPLTTLLQKQKKFVWSTECQHAFEKIKSLLLSAPVLKAPDFKKPFKLQVDASDIGIGAVLLQEGRCSIDHPVCYFSYKFNKHQVNYSTTEKETLALLLALQHFDVYLGTTIAPVEVYTDHNPLVFIEKMKNKNQRLLRWSLAFQEYNLKIRHIKGRDNVIADALSRATV